MEGGQIRLANYEEFRLALEKRGIFFPVREKLGNFEIYFNVDAMVSNGCTIQP